MNAEILKCISNEVDEIVKIRNEINDIYNSAATFYETNSFILKELTKTNDRLLNIENKTNN